MKIGCCAKNSQYQEVKQFGFDYVELYATELMRLSEKEFNAFYEAYIETGLPCLGFNAFSDEKTPIIGSDVDWERLSDYSKTLCDRGAKLKIKTIGIGAPKARNIADSFDRKTAEKQLENFLVMISEYAEPYGIEILLEPVYSKYCNFINKTEEAVKIIHALHKNNLHLTYDYYHSVNENETLDTMKRAMADIKHMHYTTGRGAEPRGLPTEANKRELVKLISTALKNGYDGNISLEPDFPFFKDGKEAAAVMHRVLEEVIASV